jgi:membrane protein DedA with SNARE-associated domain
VATAGSTAPRIALLILCAALGAFLGDNLCYLIGHRFGPRVERRFFSSARGARQRAWAEQSLDRYGIQLIIVCRFIPGGRTAVTLCCGLIGYPRRRFVPATAVAAVAWATYSFFIGRLGGRAFEDKPWAGLLLSLGITLVISGLIEAFRRIRRWSQRRQAPSADAGQPGPQQAEAQHGEPEDAAPEEDQAGRPPAGRADTGPCGVGRPDL